MQTKERIKHWAPLLIALFPAFFLFFHLKKFLGDPIIDFGSEIYLAWRLSEGAVLYRDYFYYFGPVGPYLNALALKWSSAGREILVVAGFCSFLVIAILLYDLAVKRVSKLAGFATILFITFFFGFNQLNPDADFNFLTPYRYGIVYGLVFLISAFYFLDRAARLAKKEVNLILAGAFSALCLLSKAEIFLALAGSLFLVGLAAAKAFPGNQKFLALRSFVLGFIGVLLVFLFLWMGHSGDSLARAVEVLNGPYLLLFNERVTSLPFYRILSGEGSGAVRYLWLLLGYLGMIGCPAFFLSWLSGQPRKNRTIGAIFLLAFMALALLMAWKFRPEWIVYLLHWQLGNYALCLFSGLALLGVGMREREKNLERFLLASFFLGAGLLGLKVFFGNSLNGHYGFALGLLAGSLVFLLLWESAPAILRKRRADFPAWAWRAYLLLLLAPQILVFWQTTQFYVSAKNQEYAGGEFFYQDVGHLQNLESIRAYLSQEHAGAKTLTVIPQGGYLNYSLRKPSPLYLMSLLPDQVALFGVPGILRQMGEEPADLLLVHPRQVDEFQLGTFREGYGRDIYAWVKENYVLDPNQPKAWASTGLELWLKK